MGAVMPRSPSLDVRSVPSTKPPGFAWQQRRLSSVLYTWAAIQGQAWINQIAGAERWKSEYQLDSWHYRRKLRLALRGEEKLLGELLRLLRAGEGEGHRRLLRLTRMKAQGETDKLD